MLFLPFLALLAPYLQQPDISPSGGDDTARLQRLIGSDARQASNRTIILAPGTYRLSSGLLIPEGTRNLTIQGAGRGKTVLVDASREGINKVLQVGWDIQPTSNYNIATKLEGGAGVVPNILVRSVAEADRTLTLASGPIEGGFTRRVEKGKWYLLYDDNEVVAYQGTSSIRNHAEPVFVTGVDGERITLRDPVGRDYPGKVTPRLAAIDSKFCFNIALRGFTIDCRNKPKSYNIIPVYCTIGFKASDIEIDGFMQNAISVQDSRDWEVGPAEIYTASGGQTGSGYGIVAARGSRFGKVHDIKSRLIQGHGYSIVMAHGGGSDLDCWNVTAPGGKLDIHGMDSLRITYRDSDAADLHLGNNQWLAAGHGHRAENVRLTSLVWVQAGAKDVVLRNVRATGVVLNAQFGNQGGNPPNGYPEDVTFIDCQFKDSAKAGLILGEEAGNPYRGKVGKVLFKGCSFENTDTGYGGILVWRDKFEGEMTFEGCTFRTPISPFFESMVRVKNGGGQGRARLAFDGCTFLAGHPDTGYVIGVNEWRGELVLRNNVLVTPKAGASVLAPGSRIAGLSESGSRVRKP
jgi:hypothetical protein